MRIISTVVTLTKIITLITMLILAVTAPVLADEGPVPHSLVRVYVEGREEFQLLSDMGVLDICGYSAGQGYADLVTNPFELEQLRSARFRLEILENNIDDRLEKYRENGDLGVYHSVAESDLALQEMHEAYPGITTLEVIGYSWEERPIWAMKISDNPEVDEDEPSVMYNGAHHAREWISYEVPLALAHHLLDNYGSDGAVTALVDEREIWIVPIVNPDGVQHSHTEYTMWRKNRRPAPEESAGRWWNTSKIGVDPNRNYGYMWGTTGASSYPGSDTYHGPEPFSEPEVQAIRDLTLREKFDATLTFHSYSELVLYPFGYAYDAHAPDEPALQELAVGIAQFTGYTPQKITDLYACMGTSDDWLYGEAGAFAFTIELGTWFVPDDEDVLPICETNIESCMYLLERAGNLVEERVKTIVQVQGYISSLLTDAATGSRTLSDGEQEEYMRMLKLRRVISNQLVKEVTTGCDPSAPGNPGKVLDLARSIRGVSPGLRGVFHPVVSDVLALVKHRRSNLTEEWHNALLKLSEAL